MHHQLDDSAALRPVEVKLDRVAPLPSGDVHKEALVVAVDN